VLGLAWLSGMADVDTDAAVGEQLTTKTDSETSESSCFTFVHPKNFVFLWTLSLGVPQTDRISQTKRPRMLLQETIISRSHRGGTLFSRRVQELFDSAESGPFGFAQNRSTRGGPPRSGRPMIPPSRSAFFLPLHLSPPPDPLTSSIIAISS
jgi:hypothetical protein